MVWLSVIPSRGCDCRKYIVNEKWKRLITMLRFAECKIKIVVVLLGLYIYI